MAVSNISQSPPITPVTPNTAAQMLPAKRGPDGDTPAVEAAENAATRAAEKIGGGFSKKV